MTTNNLIWAGENVNLPDQAYHVLIVGAGPVGLATAIALRK